MLIIDVPFAGIAICNAINNVVSPGYNIYAIRQNCDNKKEGNFHKFWLRQSQALLRKHLNNWYIKPSTDLQLGFRIHLKCYFSLRVEHKSLHGGVGP